MSLESNLERRKSPRFKEISLKMRIMPSMLNMRTITNRPGCVTNVKIICIEYLVNEEQLKVDPKYWHSNSLISQESFLYLCKNLQRFY